MSTPIRVVEEQRDVAPAAARRELIADVAPVILLSRLLLVAVTLIIPLWRGATGTKPLLFHTGVTDTGTILDAWDRWDAHWYDDLAHLGYNLRGPTGFKNVAFFPLYPLLTRTLHDATAVVARDVLGIVPSGSLYPPYLVMAMIVANLCTMAALVYLYVFVRHDYGRVVARRAVTLLALSPLAFFTAAAYSEGTFLLCSIAFFYALRRERWWEAGLWGLLATATRPPGAVLLVPFAMTWVEAHPAVARAWARWLHREAHALVGALRLDRRILAFRAVDTVAPLDFYRLADGARERRSANRAASVHSRWTLEVRRAVRNGLPVVVIPLGLGLFMAFLYTVFGDPLWFSKAQQAWWRTFAPPWETLVISVVWPLGDLVTGRATVVDLYAFHDFCYEVVGLALTWAAWRRLPRAQGAYLWVLWVVFLSSPAMLTERRTGEPHHDVLMSLPRMVLVMFPLFTYLGLQRRLYPWLTLAFTVALVVYTAIFLTGGWVS